MRLARTTAVLCLVSALALALPAASQEEPAADYDAIQATIERMQRRIEQMGQAAAERDEMLQFLEEQIERAAGRISGGEETQEALRQRALSLDLELESLARERAALTETVDERAALIANLEEQVARLTEMLAGERRLIQSLESDLQGRDAALAEAAAEARATAVTLAQATAARRSLETRVAALEAEQARVLEARDTQLASLQTTLGERETALGVANERIALLSAQLNELSRQLGIVETLLVTSETQIQEQQATIASLGQRLQQALIDQVEELSQYRSEFFGRLRQILGDRPEIRIVGDRFVFQSELLFASGSARLDPAGLDQLRALAQSLREVADKIPPEIEWVLSVDGHTDRVPVGAASPFASNWELSTQRAISVVEFLISQGIEPRRLAATGFGEYRPIDPRDDEIAYRRNRRIEFKLTSG